MPKKPTKKKARATKTSKTRKPTKATRPKNSPRKAVKKPRAKSPVKKPTPKKRVTRKPVKRPAKKPTKKPAAKKPKKSPARKAPAKKKSARKAPAKVRRPAKAKKPAATRRKPAKRSARPRGPTKRELELQAQLDELRRQVETLKAQQAPPPALPVPEQRQADTLHELTRSSQAAAPDDKYARSIAWFSGHLERAIRTGYLKNVPGVPEALTQNPLAVASSVRLVITTEGKRGRKYVQRFSATSWAEFSTKESYRKQFALWSASISERPIDARFAFDVEGHRVETEYELPDFDQQLDIDDPDEAQE